MAFNLAMAVFLCLWQKHKSIFLLHNHHKNKENTKNERDNMIKANEKLCTSPSLITWVKRVICGSCSSYISGCRCLWEKCWVELSVYCRIWWQSRDLINTNSTSVSISLQWALALANTRTIFPWLWSELNSHQVWNTALQLNNPNVLTSLSHSINICNQWLWQR